MQPTAMPKLAVPETVVVAPDVDLLQGGQIGDPMSRFTQALSNGPGGPGGTGTGCCDGVGDSVGPHAGSGPPGIYPAGRGGVTVPQVIYNPEPSFSEEARKAKQQGIVQLLLVVGKDGHTHDIRVAQPLGMGLDEKAIEAVSQWRFKPATVRRSRRESWSKCNSTCTDGNHHLSLEITDGELPVSRFSSIEYYRNIKVALPGLFPLPSWYILRSTCSTSITVSQ